MNLWLELQAVTTTDFISTDYTIDRAKPQIRQWKYSGQGRRMSLEINASQAFATAHPGQFNGDREKLTRDMSLFSVLAYLGAEQFDWQIKRVRFKGPSSGTEILSEPGSKPDECTNVSRDQLHKMLSGAGNSFANGNMFFGATSLCLPPRSTLLILANPFCDVSFALESSGSVMFFQPGTGGDVPQLPNGEAKLETRNIGIRVTTHYSAIRAQHRDMQKYKEWSKRIVAGAQGWFEGVERERL